MAQGDHEVKKGDHYEWTKEVSTLAIIEAEVIRVGKNKDWADVRYTQKVDSHVTATWTKREPLPLSDAFERVQGVTITPEDLAHREDESGEERTH